MSPWVYLDCIQELPTLDLVQDCFCFVTSFFETISASSPHIYHSALMLAPKRSIVWRLYESHAHPFVRFVYGVPMLWDASTLSTKFRGLISLATWSPCNRFIAIGDYFLVEILDPVTLQHLQVLRLSKDIDLKEIHALVFSPDSHIITLLGIESDQGIFLISWDLQTGGTASKIRHQLHLSHAPTSSLAYSEDGKMVAVCCMCLYEDKSLPVLSIFDIVSGIHICSHPLAGDIDQNISRRCCWIQGKSFHCVAWDARAVTIWEVGFNSDATPTKRIFYIPDNFGSHKLSGVQVLPTPLRLVFWSEKNVLVVDPQNSTSLLHYTDGGSPHSLSFSSNGHIFAFSASRSDVYLWKESPTGYIPHKKIMTSVPDSRSLLSPNGDFVITCGFDRIQLWHTKGFATSPSSVSAAASFYDDFILDFSADGVLAVVARRKDTTVTVLNLKSGIPQLTIDVGTEVHGLQVIGDTIAIVDTWKMVGWNLHTGDCLPDVRVGFENHNLDCSRPGYKAAGKLPAPLGWIPHISISPDFHHIIIISHLPEMSIFSATTGAHLIDTYVEGRVPWFSADECKIWSIFYDDRTYVQRAGDIWDRVDNLPEGCPWASSHGYQVTADWWILAPNGKHLLMLPLPWRDFAMYRVWKGQFLALLHARLVEPVILELL